ncbi:hypothetical protein V2G26_010407 [Clonostachys chloroleuca]
MDHMPPPSSQMPPPSSQSHFEKFDNFVPDSSASFEDEFARLASSQDWAAGTSEFQKQRTIALRSELKLHYFSASQNIEEGQEDVEDPPSQKRRSWLVIKPCVKKWTSPRMTRSKNAKNTSRKRLSTSST